MFEMWIFLISKLGSSNTPNQTYLFKWNQLMLIGKTGLNTFKNIWLGLTTSRVNWMLTFWASTKIIRKRCLEMISQSKMFASLSDSLVTLRVQMTSPHMWLDFLNYCTLSSQFKKFLSASTLTIRLSSRT